MLTRFFIRFSWLSNFMDWQTSIYRTINFKARFLLVLNLVETMYSGVSLDHDIELSYSTVLNIWLSFSTNFKCLFRYCAWYSTLFREIFCKKYFKNFTKLTSRQVFWDTKRQSCWPVVDKQIFRLVSPSHTWTIHLNFKPFCVRLRSISFWLRPTFTFIKITPFGASCVTFCQMNCIHSTIYKMLQQFIWSRSDINVSN